jgi:hypothetical protein
MHVVRQALGRLQALVAHPDGRSADPFWVAAHLRPSLRRSTLHLHAFLMYSSALCPTLAMEVRTPMQQANYQRR